MVIYKEHSERFMVLMGESNYWLNRLFIENARVMKSFRFITSKIQLLFVERKSKKRDDERSTTSKGAWLRRHDMKILYKRRFFCVFRRFTREENRI